MSLKNSGLLNGEEDRRRKARDVKDYPDITALALLAKTKAQFREILASPPRSPSTPGSPVAEADLEPWEAPSEARMDPQRADLLWNLAGYGSPELKPLASDELETDGAPKTGVYLLSSPKTGPSKDPLHFEHLPFHSIFKPLDEEAFERRGIENGTGALREEAAFVIDHAAGGACVPVTARMSLEEGGVRKKGSVQEFVEGSIGPVENFGMPKDLPSAEATISLDSVQAVACLDIRIFNTDRHTGNLLLAGERPHRIICIDHGCVLPAWWALDAARFDAWLDWPHVRAKPSAATLRLIEQVSSSLPRVTQALEKLGLSRQAIWTLEICTKLLHCGVITHGLTLRSVGLLMTRADPAEPCWLEQKIKQACLAAGVSAEFVPEGKYGDLVLHVDRYLMNQFFEVATSKRLCRFRDAFFLFLTDAFGHEDVKNAAQAIEEAMRPPW